MLDGNRGVGKSNVFSDGEWSGEPDLLEFEVYGFKCYAKRHDSMGHLCGYIVVDGTHPWHGKGYDEVDADIHGGLTYSGAMPNYTTFGFDCAHAGDLVPKIVHLAHNYSGDVYRGMGYVVGELIKLAKQAKEASDGQESN
jgi:hypothetical protein